MNTVRIPFLLLAATLAASLAACSEKPQVATYEVDNDQGRYQGKADTRPWDSAAFKGDKQAWEGAMRQRTQKQNEYQRTE